MMTPADLQARAIEALIAKWSQYMRVKDNCPVDEEQLIRDLLKDYEAALWCDDMDAATVGRYVIAQDNKGGVRPGCFINDGTFWEVGQTPTGTRSDFKRWRYPPAAPGEG